MDAFAPSANEEVYEICAKLLNRLNFLQFCKVQSAQASQQIMLYIAYGGDVDLESEMGRRFFSQTN